MADTRKITIEIIDKGSSEENNETPLKKNLPKSERKKQGGKKTAEEMYLNSAAQKAISTLGNAMNLSINRYFSLQEDYLAENIYRNAKTTIGKVESLYGSIKAGAAISGTFGVVGAVIWGVSEGLNQFQRYSNYYAQLNATNAQTEFSQKRAGLYNNGRGTEN